MRTLPWLNSDKTKNGHPRHAGRSDRLISLSYHRIYDRIDISPVNCLAQLVELAIGECWSHLPMAFCFRLSS